MSSADAARLLPVLRLGAVALALVGLVLIAVGGAHSFQALTGFAMFCLAIAALDGIYRRAFGPRQLAVLLGWFGVGLGVWGMATAGVSEILEVPVTREVRAVLVVAGVSIAGALACVALTVLLRGRSFSFPVRRRPRTAGFGPEASPPGGRRPGRPGAAGRPSPPAGPRRGG